MGIGRKRSETGGENPGAAKIMRDALSLFSGFNEAPDVQSGSEIGQKVPLLSLDMDDDELTSLSKSWLADWNKYKGEIESRQEHNEKYWKGQHYGFDKGDYRSVDNVIFESVETIIPIITRKNPEPVVTTDSDAESQRFADLTADIIADLADINVLKLKARMASRHWLIYLLGVIKLGWDFVDDTMSFYVVHPKNIVLDPSGSFDGGEFIGSYIGEKKTETAETMITKFPAKKEIILKMVDKKLGTKCTYYEWWTDKFTFWEFKGFILDKRKNPHWNYDEKVVQMNEEGVEIEVETQPKNHFNTPKKPYSFMYYFSTGEQPHDETSIIEQASPLQDGVNKRSRQIDKNADDTNNGWVFNNQFSQEEASRALNALRRGGAIIAPTDQIGAAVQRFNAPALPAYIFNDMLDKREQIKNMFGVRGSTAEGIVSERTVGGKIEIQGADTDRAEPIIEQLEQTVDYLYNYTVQMIYVYYTAETLEIILGKEKAMEYMRLKETSSRLRVSVKEGSMIPEDKLLRRNEAVELYSAGALDPLTLFERMDFPNPNETAKRVIEYKTDPMALLQSEGLVEQPLVPPEGMQVPPPDQFLSPQI